jgi:tetratricopeptide (TPR) repeat protein
MTARLRRDRTLTASVLVDQLTGRPDHPSGLSLGADNAGDGVLNLAYRELSAGPSRLYRILGLLPYPVFDVAAAAAAAAEPVSAIRIQLDALVACGLLQRESGTRYLVHPDVHGHARGLATAGGFDAIGESVLTRVVEHYLHSAVLADRALHPQRWRLGDVYATAGQERGPFGDAGALSAKDRALQWLEAERSALVVMVRTAHEHGWDAVAWQLAEALAAFFAYRPHLDECRQSLEIGALAAGRADRPDAEARLRCLLSRPLLELGQDAEAKAQLERALVCAGQSGDRRSEASVLECWGRYWLRHDPVRAQVAFQQCRELYGQLGESHAAASAQFLLGCAQDAAGDPARALASLEQAVVALWACSDNRLAARALTARGRAHARLGHTAAAREDLEQACAMLRSLGAVLDEATAHRYLADLLQHSGEPAVVVQRHLERAEQIHHQVSGQQVHGRAEGSTGP